MTLATTIGELGASFYLWATPAALVMVGIAIALGALRLLRGPSLPDRVVALDLIGTVAVGAIAVFSMREAEPAYLTVSVVLAVVLFVGTIAFAFYLERGQPRS